MNRSALDVLTLAIDDVEEYERLSKVEGWDVDAVQLSAGGHSGRYSGVELPQMSLALEDLGRTSMSMIGMPPHGALPIILPLKIGHSLRFRGADVAEAGALIVGQGDEVDFIVEGGLRFAAIYLTPEAWLAIRLASFGPAAGALDRNPQGRFITGSRALNELKSRISLLFRSDQMASGGNSAAPTVDRVSETVSASLVTALSQQAGVRLEGADSIGNGRAALARRARAFMEDNLYRPLPLAELCVEVGVSLRTLQYAFAGYYGVSPAKYHALRRLAGVRRDLKESSPTGRTVTEVAMDWGFWHLGRFSQAYRTQFGETPSETLASRSTRVFVRATEPDAVDLPSLRSLAPAE